jgi:hypothetical protein
MEGGGSAGPFLLIYVDDILLVGRLAALSEVKVGHAELFTITDMGDAHFFLGIGLERDWEKGTITLTQGRYGRDILDRFGMVECKPTSTPIPPGFKFHLQEGSPEDCKEYQSAVGSMMYLVTRTRPDLAFAVSAASRHMSQPLAGH